ncbi:thioredoxin domain-containing protein [Sinobaca sp. H24]|uniref:thioredoxin domain-containing protein n=1 Tax=Sinobaca sp. H24 TaxID=2923376 RepID=UPI00207A7F38|nr:thioredoxin domain-containing protein [Sinobaca sp. H24]
MNKLQYEKSPYLLQHKDNPVDWFPWGEEAFEKARKENKPVLVSIGYSTCHWCHVMEEESFADEETAALLNERMIAIKVDREERPDIDAIYMKACQAMTGRGGWPLNVFLTPDQKPFYAGTYFPKKSMQGMPGITDVVTQLSDKYKEDPAKIEQVSSQMEIVLQPGDTSSQMDIGRETLAQGYGQLFHSFDKLHGGFGSAPKFPTPHTILFLLRYYQDTNEAEALNMAVQTLDHMASGGIYDHIGFGFSRYSVDEKWLIPHFEKMLYDNALLLMAYTEAYQITKERRFRKTAEDIQTYLLRDMQDGKGGFYSGEDADSEGVEGKFYTWTPDELKQVLGDDLAEQYGAVYHITEHGNFEGKNIPHMIGSSISEAALSFQIDEGEFRERLEEARHKLFEARKKRTAPLKDDKILTSWNGLTIAALAKAGRVFKKADSLIAAKQAYSFIEKELYNNERLMVRFRDGEVKHKGFLEDYANMLWASIEMYESTFELHYLEQAKSLGHEMIRLFWDEAEGGFFFYGSDAESLLVRPKETSDGAMPSGNSIAAYQLLRLGRLTGDPVFENTAKACVQAFSGNLAQYPQSHMYFLQALGALVASSKEVVILSSMEDEETKYIVDTLQEDFHPNVTFLVAEEAEELQPAVRFIKGYKKLENSTTIYVCENYSCHTPVTSAAEAVDLIKGTSE